MSNSFQSYLKNCLDCVDSRVKEAMYYSLLAGGKRLRPLMIFTILQGYETDIEYGYNAASSLEMIHTYSLIHDDLPAMDNDNLRRGKKTCHKQFDEATAILAGDGLLTYAFENITKSDYSLEIKYDLMKVISETSGCSGMIYGQILDMEQENKLNLSVTDINSCYHNKTAKLFESALKIGMILTNHQENFKTVAEIAYNLGIAFQIQDDLLDLNNTELELGKTNSDLENSKMTYISLFDEKLATKAMNDYFDNCYKLILGIDFDSSYLIELIDKIRYRKK
jgi:geranylgeranyl pyrophosphate synthase